MRTGNLLASPVCTKSVKAFLVPAKTQTKSNDYVVVGIVPCKSGACEREKSTEEHKAFEPNWVPKSMNVIFCDSADNVRWADELLISSEVCR